MMKFWRDGVVGVCLACSYALQVALTSHRFSSSSLLVGGSIAIIGGVGWMTRRRLTAHIDMLLLMGGFGGFGMLLGGIADGGPTCHAGGIHIISWMNVGMIAGGFLPALTLARCMVAAWQEGRLLMVIAMDLIAMELGMLIPSVVAALVKLSPTILGVWAHPLAVGGMLTGMGIAMTLQSTWVRAPGGEAPESQVTIHAVS